MLITQLCGVGRMVSIYPTQLPSIEAAINRHDQTLYEFVVKPVRDKEDAADEKK
jgi:hypothetical protein